MSEHQSEIFSCLDQQTTLSSEQLTYLVDSHVAEKSLFVLPRLQSPSNPSLNAHSVHSIQNLLDSFIIARLKGNNSVHCKEGITNRAQHSQWVPYEHQLFSKASYYWGRHSPSHISTISHTWFGSSGGPISRSMADPCFCGCRRPRGSSLTRGIFSFPSSSSSTCKQNRNKITPERFYDRINLELKFKEWNNNSLIKSESLLFQRQVVEPEKIKLMFVISCE